MVEPKAKTKVVSPEQFVRVWQTASSLEDVAHKIGITVDGAQARATYYKKNGVILRKFRKARKKNDWAALARLAGELGGTVGAVGK